MSASIGSLFSGYGGLDIGVSAALDARVVWHCELESAVCRVLAHHWPDVPNHGDITRVDWATVEPVDVLVGGFPCQDVSSAGLRRGISASSRSGLWSQFAVAIAALSPRLVIIENVRGLLYAPADSQMEPCPYCLGDDAEQPALRALGAVLGDLADLGYDTRWCGVYASDAGAPHKRFRIFVVAWPHADDAARELRQWQRRPVEPAHEAQTRRADHDAAADTGRSSVERRRELDELADETHAAERSTEQRQRDGHAVDDRDATAADTDSADSERIGQQSRPDECHADRRTRAGEVAHEEHEWGPYGDAVRRWELVSGRAAPAPTTANRSGKQRLSPLFVEWMMGLESGHVTADEIGLTRIEQLRALGNGVVPQQAELAVVSLIDDVVAGGFER